MSCYSVVGALLVNKEQLIKCSGLGFTDIHELIINFYCILQLPAIVLENCVKMKWMQDVKRQTEQSHVLLLSRLLRVQFTEDRAD